MTEILRHSLEFAGPRLETLDGLTFDGRQPETLAEVDEVESWLRFAITVETLKSSGQMTPELIDAHARMDGLRHQEFELKYGPDTRF